MVTKGPKCTLEIFHSINLVTEYSEENEGSAEPFPDIIIVLDPGGPKVTDPDPEHWC
jgi:hypothetical protein